MSQLTAVKQLDAMIAKYSPAVARAARAILRKARKLAPGAVELVYDNYNALVIAFAGGEKMSDIAFSIALYPRWVNLFVFARGIPDPQKVLEGSGKMVRRVTLDPPTRIDEPAVRAIVRHVVAKSAIAPKARRRVVVKAVVKKQRPRRP